MKKAVKQDQDNLDCLIAPAVKFGILLYNSTMPENIKDAWLELLPEMSLRQIAAFSEILEEKYLDDQTREIDEKYQEKLEQLFSKYRQEDEDYDKKMLEQIKILEEHF